MKCFRAQYICYVNNYNAIIIHVQTFTETCYLWDVRKF